MANVFENLPVGLPDELITTLHQAKSLRIERIVSHGHCSPDGFWYDQSDHEWVMVLAGEARLQFEEKELLMRAGDCANIPAHQKHRVAWTTPDVPTVWLAIFYAAEER